MSARGPANPLRPLARAQRLSLRGQWVRAFFAAVDRGGSSYQAVADACGRTREKVSGWASIEDGAPLPTVLDVLSMPRAVRAELLAWIAMRDEHALSPVRPDGLEHAARASVLTRECTDPVRAYVAALADGHVSPVERAEVCRELRELIAAASSALCSLEQEQNGQEKTA